MSVYASAHVNLRAAASDELWRTLNVSGLLAMTP
jgi:hypothetical protein